MAWVYILRCADASYYVGSTIDLERRISQHNLSEGSAYTRRRGRRPVVLAWAAEFQCVDAAFEFEKQLQGWGRAKREALVDGRFADLPALARGLCRRPLVPEPAREGDVECDDDDAGSEDVPAGEG